ncbi:MAG: tripartite tricarboxylate transporter permease, partial [Pseudomonadota bacterium]
MYMLAAVILGLASIGVFALNNVADDIWTLLWFGILGFFMRQFGFPLAPMILGVVLGNIAELNLSRALAISTDYTLFFTRPWALFFFIIAIFSAVFPLFQKARAEGKKWVRYYAPALLVSISLPLSMMGGAVRPGLALLCLCLAAFLGYRAYKSASAPA